MRRIVAVIIVCIFFMAQVALAATTKKAATPTKATPKKVTTATQAQKKAQTIVHSAATLTRHEPMHITVPVVHRTTTVAKAAVAKPAAKPSVSHISAAKPAAKQSVSQKGVGAKVGNAGVKVEGE